MVGEWIDRGDLWRNKALSLQIRLRDRFRVAVDRHRHRPRFSDGYFSSKMERWLRRFRTFRKDTLPSTAAFYRKRGRNIKVALWNYQLRAHMLEASRPFNSDSVVSSSLYVVQNSDAEEDSVITRMLQAVAVPVLGNVCHVFMHGLNRVQIYGAEKLQKALVDRPEKQPLLTVSNHVASMDDPLVIASLLPPGILLDAHKLRWTLCATDRCFRNPVTSAFFRSVKVLPVSRGEGIYQKGMDMAISKLNRGGWVHIFPEGSRSRDGGKTLGSAKRGVGRLVLDADDMPLVVPFVHIGMQDIMPVGAKFPRIGKTVTVLIGDPIYFDDLLTEADDIEERGNLYDVVSSRIGNRLQELKFQVERLAIEQSQELLNYPLRSTERAAGYLQQIDWDSFGMGGGGLLTTTEEADSSKLNREVRVEPRTEITNLPPLERVDSISRHFRVGFSCGGGIVSRIRGYMDPTELMGFAARGLFMNRYG